MSRKLRHVEKKGKQIWIQCKKISKENKKNKNKKNNKKKQKQIISRKLRHVEKNRKQIWIQRMKINKNKKNNKKRGPIRGLEPLGDRGGDEVPPVVHL